ncbi:MAG: TlpA family protein disulfide reductase [Deltaproteobacteria bacterium]|nr:TlpA family protein disulfide reductase [Deltaproteobacteria bacterium]
MRTAGNIATILILVLMATTVSMAGQAENAGTKPASAAATGIQEWVDFTLPEPGGGHVSLAQFIGKKPVLLVFWATWCAICKEEVPVINRMHSEPPMSGKVQILALDFMESEKKVNAFISSKKVAYPVLLDRRGRVARKYKVVGIPTFILIDRDGKVVYRDHDLSEIRKVLE